MAPRIKNPTRSSRNETVFFDRGIALSKDEGGRTYRDTEIRGPGESETYSSPRAAASPSLRVSQFFIFIFILHPFLVSSQKFLNVGVLGMSQAFVRPAENDIPIAHHHHLAIS